MLSLPFSVPDYVVIRYVPEDSVTSLDRLPARPMYVTYPVVHNYQNHFANSAIALLV